MDFRQLRYLRCIVRSQSFTRAAKILGVAQPALTLHVKRLEQELGTPLLVRHSRGVNPTRAGEILIERADWIMEELERTKNLIRSLAVGTKANVLDFDSTSSSFAPWPVSGSAVN